jgi:hypothetical protein
MEGLKKFKKYNNVIKLYISSIRALSMYGNLVDY